MANYGKVEGGVITQSSVADADWAASQPDTWVELPWGVGIGWNYDGVSFTDSNGASPPPEPPPRVRYRYLLTGSEWVLRFADAEWQWLKTRRNDGTTAGDQLDRFMDAIRWTDSIDISSTSVDPFYTWLLDNGIPGGQTRIDELRAGILL